VHHIPCLESRSAARAAPWTLAAEALIFSRAWSRHRWAARARRPRWPRPRNPRARPSRTRSVIEDLPGSLNEADQPHGHLSGGRLPGSL